MNNKNIKLICNIAGEVIKVVVPILITTLITKNDIK